MSGGTFGTNWLDLSNTATTNFLIRSYVQGFVDISGGNLILRNNNFYMTGGDASINGRVLVTSDVSMGGRLYVQGASTFQTAPIMSGANITTGTIPASAIAGGVQTNGMDLSTNQTVNGVKTFGNILTASAGIVSFTDASFNTRLFVGGDASFNGNVFIKGGLTVQQLQNQNIINTTTTNYQLIVSEDISLNGRLFVSGDVSMNSRMYVGGTSIHVGDASFNNRVLVGSDVSLGGRLYVPSNSSLIIGGVPFTGGTVFTGGSVANDISLNTRLFVGGDVSMNSRMYVAGTSIHVGDASFNGNVYISSPIAAINATQTWNTSAGTNLPAIASYTGVAVSNNGQYVLAVAEGTGAIYLSINSGSSWTATPPTGLPTTNVNWENAKMSSSGQYMIASNVVEGKVYLSSNYGSNWASCLTINAPYAIDMSPTGQYILVNGYNSQPALSSNYGSTFTSITSIATNTTYSIKGAAISSANAQYMTVIGGAGIAYLSSNTGSTWSPISGLPTVTWGTISISSTGQYIIAGSYGGSVYVSNNYGASWTTNPTGLPSTSTNWACSYVSTTGQYMLLGGRSTVMYFSTNYGVSFSSYSNLTSSAFNGIAVSPDLTYFYACIYGGVIKTSTLPYAGQTQFNISAQSTFNNLVTLNSGIISISDASFNNRVLVGSDVSLGGRLYVTGNATVNSLNTSGLINFNTTLTSPTIIPDASQSVIPAAVSGLAAPYSQSWVWNGVTWTVTSSVINGTTLGQAVVPGTGYINSYYPAAAFVTYATNVSQGSGGVRSWGYLGYHSSTLTNGYFPFNGSVSAYTTTSGVTGGIGTLYGNWIQLQLSTANSITSFAMAPERQQSSTYSMEGPGAFYILGTNDNTFSSWDPILYGLFPANTQVNNNTTNAYYTLFTSAVSTTAKVTEIYPIPSGTASSVVNGQLTYTTYGNATKTYTYFRLVVVGGQRAGGAFFNLYYTFATSAPSNAMILLNNTSANVLDVSGTLQANKGLNVINSDASIGGRLFVSGDVSLNSRLFVNGNVGIGTMSTNYTLDVSGGAEFTQDISMGGRLLVGGDTSLNSRLYVAGTSNLIGDASFNNRILVGGDASFGGRIFLPANSVADSALSTNIATLTGSQTLTNKTITTSGLLTVGAGLVTTVGDASFNNRVLVGSDVSLGGRLYVAGNTELSGNLLIKGGLTVQQLQNQNIINTTTTNYQLIVSEDISLNGRFFVSGDTSLNSRLYVAGTSNLIGDASFNNKVFVGGDVSLNSRLFVNGNIGIGTTSPNYTLDVSGGAEFTQDISMGGILFVGGDVSLNSRLYVAGTSIHVGDASFNNRILVGGDASFGGRIFLPAGSIADSALSTNIVTLTGGQILTNKTLTAPTITSITNSGTITVPSGTDTLVGRNTTDTLTNKTITTSGLLTVGAGLVTTAGDASFNNRILVGGDASFGGRIFLPAGSIADSALSTNIATLTGSQILTNKTITTSGLLTVGAGLVMTAGDASFNNRILVGGDASFGGRIFLPANSVADSALSTNIATLTGSQILTNKTITTTGLLTVGAGLVMTAGDASFNNRVFIGSDVSMGSRLYVQGDVSINGNLLIKGGLTVQQLQNQNIINTTTTNYQLIVSEDISLNGRLFSSGDASFGSRLYVGGTSLHIGDASFNSRILVAGDASFGGRLYIFGDSSFNGNVSINGNLTAKYSPGAIPGYAINGQFGINNAGLALVTGDVSFNGNVTVGQNLAIGKANAQYSIDTPGIASCGAVFQFDAASGVNTLNTSMVGGVYNSQILNANAGLTVPLGQTTTLSGPVSTNAITMNGLATMTGGFAVTTGNATITSGNLTIGSAGLFVNGNTALSGITTLGNTAVFLTDASINGRLLIGGDISYNRGVNIFGNLTIGSVSAGSGYAIAPLDIRPTGVITNITTGTTLASFSGITSSNIPLTSNRVNMNLSSFIDSNGLPTNSISAIDDGAGSGSLIFSSKTGYGTGSVAMTERMRITSSGQVGIGTFIAGTNNIAPNYALDINGNTNIRNNLNIQGNIIVPSSGVHTINGNLSTTTSTTGNSIVTYNETVGGTETIGGLLTANGGILSLSDASFMTRVLVATDVSMGGRLFVQGAAQFTGQATFLSGLNYQVGTAITTTTTLTTPLAQFYTVNCGTAYTITLPAPATVTKGQYFSFKRVTTAAGIITITSPTASAIIPYNSITGATSITIPTTNFSTGFICDGTNYYQLTLA